MATLGNPTNTIEVLKKYNFLRKAGNDDVIENIQLIHRRFKECMLKNVPDQMRIEDIL